jgi:hypothetical protein
MKMCNSVLVIGMASEIKTIIQESSDEKNQLLAMHHIHNYTTIQHNL